METFAEFLVSLLDTPRKMQLLSDIRYVVLDKLCTQNHLALLAIAGLSLIRPTW